MANSLRQLISVAGFAALCAPAAWGCGGWFEEAPPLLSRYLDRLPAKSFGTVYLETQPPAPTLPPVDLAQVAQLAQSAGKEKRPGLLNRVDALLAAARGNYEDSYWCNLLQDLRAALLTSATDREVADYLIWRVGHASFFELKPKPSPDDYRAEAPKPVAGSPAAREIEERLTAAPEALRAQWLYLRGALGFAAGERKECVAWFEQAVALSPPQPRGEAALFLLARCRLSESREGLPYSGDIAPEEHRARSEQHNQEMAARAGEARRLFERYLSLYPAGQYVADAHGWLGALDFAGGDHIAALQDYIRQLETPGHPEVAKSALLMCERVVDAAEPDDSLFAVLAAHPTVAMGTTYLMLNTGEFALFGSDQADAAVSARQKQWRARMLPRLAAAVADHQAAYAPGVWPARYLALLAQAASAAGQQDKALALTSLPNDPAAANDDLLLARGIAQQRSGRPQEAIECFRQLIARFPQSPLVRGVRLKMALALQDNHQAGLAIVELKRLRKELDAMGPDASNPPRFDDDVYPPADSALKLEQSAVHSNISGAERSQIDQLIDTLYNFAPLPELEAAITAADDEAAKAELRGVLAQRCLAREDFVAAKRVMPAEDYASRVAPLAELVHKAAAITDAAARAAAMVEVGDAWAAARGKLLALPLDGAMTGIFESQSDQTELRRRINGQSLGYRGVDTELEDRDELRHAARWWSRAAPQCADPALAAAAEWKALRSIPLIANASAYAFLRARETDEASASKRAFEHLRSKYPGSPEARQRAAYWSFPMERLAEGQFPSFEEDRSRELTAVGKMGYSHLDYGAFGLTTDFGAWDSAPTDSRDQWQEIAAKMANLPEHADWDNPRMAAEVDSLRQQAAAIYESIGLISYINVLDDLALVLREPKLTPAARAAYLKIRLQDIPPKDRSDSINPLAAMNDPALSPVADYIDFLRAVKSVPHREAPEADGGTYLVARVDYAELERAMANFLAAHPRSSKREAAALVRARAVHWLTTPSVSPPEQEGNDAPAPPAAFDRRRALEPLDAYDREFPQGRYAAQIRDWRATAAFQSRDWQTALDLTWPELLDDSHPDLKPEASLRLANIFAALGVEETRPVVLEHIRSRPQVIARLQQYLAKAPERRDHPLRYLGDYLADQLAFPEPTSPQGDDGARFD